MNCLDLSISIHALLGVTLILASTQLMLSVGNIVRGFGVFCFSLGYIVFGLSASGNNLTNITFNRRYIIALASIVCIIAGTLMMYYHVQDRIKRAFESKMNGLKQDIVKSIPLILVNVGYLGLLITISIKDDNTFTFNSIKTGLAVGAFIAIGYTKYKLINGLIDGKDIKNYQIANILSYGLLVLAVGYNC